jgi:glycine dehydrogenase
MSVRLSHPDVFENRHLGPSARDQKKCSRCSACPRSRPSRRRSSLRPSGRTRPSASSRPPPSARCSTYIGMGYSDTITPPRDPAEHRGEPGLVHAVHAVPGRDRAGAPRGAPELPDDGGDLTGLPAGWRVAARRGHGRGRGDAMCYSIGQGGDDAQKTSFFVARIATRRRSRWCKTRAESLGISARRAIPRADRPSATLCGVLVQYPRTSGEVSDLRPFASRRTRRARWSSWRRTCSRSRSSRRRASSGADIASAAQRFGVPMGYGGPHAAFIARATSTCASCRGASSACRGRARQPALRMALQTREQHIRREKATSNICTAQALLAIMAGCTPVYHGPRG